MAMRSSPNGLGLNARFLDYLRTIHELEFWVVLDSPKIVNSETIFGQSRVGL